MMEQVADVPLAEPSCISMAGSRSARSSCSILSDTLNRPVSTLALSEISAAGTAALAACKAGLLASLEAWHAKRVVTRRVEPGSGVQAAAENHAQWLRWIDRL